MQIQLLHKRVVAIATAIDMNFAVFFKGIDVVKHKERVCREDSNAVALFSVDDMKSGTLFWIPVEPVFVTGPKESVAEKSPEV